MKMAASESEATQAFPNPPSILYKLYTDEAVESGSAPKPPPPVQGHYQMFGAPFNTGDAMIRSLEEQNVQRLYPQQYDKKVELKKLNRSILICFLELLDILIDNPSSPERNDKIKDLSILFINMHHLINEYRPHQARETLRVVLERQKRQRDEMIQQITRAMEKAQTILKTCDGSLKQLITTLPAAEDEQEEMETSQANEKTDQNPVTLDSFVDSQDRDLIKYVDTFK
ncbi:PREDICTED: mediator of RNA polymerase II transcription subunit 7-like [Amphimedon queenslandica]|nr:PREDICTED: mediator of RNA polymerase II transcription subunit 7-like [Amphimedon queenslandica]|eukprot:XP_003388722.2 PREDICTED: mediator of RNA polymerase II transcription subunit 7-like [Amphimedon queenslandica]